MDFLSGLFPNLWYNLIFRFINQFNNETIWVLKHSAINFCHISFAFWGCWSSLLDFLSQKISQLSILYSGHHNFLSYFYDNHLYRPEFNPKPSGCDHLWKCCWIFSYTFDADIVWFRLWAMFPDGRGTSYWIIKWWCYAINIFPFPYYYRCYKIGDKDTVTGSYYYLHSLGSFRNHLFLFRENRFKKTKCWTIRAYNEPSWRFLTGIKQLELISRINWEKWGGERERSWSLNGISTAITLKNWRYWGQRSLCMIDVINDKNDKSFESIRTNSYWGIYYWGHIFEFLRRCSLV